MICLDFGGENRESRHSLATDDRVGVAGQILDQGTLKNGNFSVTDYGIY